MYIILKIFHVTWFIPCFIVRIFGRYCVIINNALSLNSVLS